MFFLSAHNYSSKALKSTEKYVKGKLLKTQKTMNKVNKKIEKAKNKGKYTKANKQERKLDNL